MLTNTLITTSLSSHSYSHAVRTFMSFLFFFKSFSICLLGPGGRVSQSAVIGCVMQHLKRAFRTVVMISISAFSSILTTSVKGGLTSGLASQHRVIISPRTGRQSFGTIGRTPLFTTAKAACTAVIFWNGSIPVMSSHRTIPKL